MGFVGPVVAVRQGASAKDGLTDAHHRSAFFDGDLEIPGHAHGQLLQPDAGVHALAQLLAQVAQPHKTLAHAFRIAGEQCQCHQPAHAQRRERGQLCVAPILLNLTRLYPQLSIDLSFGDRTVDLIEEGFDLAIRIGPCMAFLSMACSHFLRAHWPVSARESPEPYC